MRETFQTMLLIVYKHLRIFITIAVVFVMKTVFSTLRVCCVQITFNTLQYTLWTTNRQVSFWWQKKALESSQIIGLCVRNYAFVGLRCVWSVLIFHLHWEEMTRMKERGDKLNSSWLCFSHILFPHHNPHFKPSFSSHTCAIFFIWTIHTHIIENISTWTRNWTTQSTVSNATTQLSQNLSLQVSEYIYE